MDFIASPVTMILYTWAWDSNLVIKSINCQRIEGAIMMDLKNLSPGVHMRLMLGWAISNATITNTIMIHFIINAGTSYMW